MSKFRRLHLKAHYQLPWIVLFCEALRCGQKLFPGVGAGPSLVPPGCSALIVLLQNVFHDLRDDLLPHKLKEEFSPLFKMKGKKKILHCILIVCDAGRDVGKRVPETPEEIGISVVISHQQEDQEVAFLFIYFLGSHCVFIALSLWEGVSPTPFPSIHRLVDWSWLWASYCCSSAVPGSWWTLSKDLFSEERSAWRQELSLSHHCPIPRCHPGTHIASAL